MTTAQGLRDPTAAPSLEELDERMSRLEVDLIKVRVRLEEVVDAAGRSARALGGLECLLQDIAALEGRRVDDDR